MLCWVYLNSVVICLQQDGSLERLSSAEFVSLSQAVEAFVRDSEELCGRTRLSLRGELQNQAKRFVHRFHEERKNKLRYAHMCGAVKLSPVPLVFWICFCLWQQLVGQRRRTWVFETTTIFGLCFSVRFCNTYHCWIMFNILGYEI